MTIVGPCSYASHGTDGPNDMQSLSTSGGKRGLERVAGGRHQSGRQPCDGDYVGETARSTNAFRTKPKAMGSRRNVSKKDG